MEACSSVQRDRQIEDLRIQEVFQRLVFYLGSFDGRSDSTGNTSKRLNRQAGQSRRILDRYDNVDKSALCPAALC